MTDGNTRKKAQAVFFSLVMVLSMVGGTVAFAGSAAAASDTVTLHDSAQGDQLTYAADGETVYVKVTDGTSSGGTNTATVDNGGNSFDITVYDDGSGPDDAADDGVYWGSFTITSGPTDAASDELSVSDGGTATVSADLDGTGDGSSVAATADYTGPSFGDTSLSPADGDTITTTTPTIEMSISDATSEVNVSTIEVTITEQATGEVVTSLVNIGKSGDGVEYSNGNLTIDTSASNIPDLKDGSTYVVSVSADDAAGNSGDISTSLGNSYTFSVDTTGLTFALENPSNAVVPDDEIVTGDPTQLIQVDINPNGNDAEVNDSTASLTVTGPDGNEILTRDENTDYTTADNTFSVTPTNDLPEGDITVKASAEDTNGNPSSATYTFEVDDTRPNVTSVTISDTLINDEDTSNSVTVDVTFDEPVDEDSVSAEIRFGGTSQQTLNSFDDGSGDTYSTTVSETFTPNANFDDVENSSALVKVTAAEDQVDTSVNTLYASQNTTFEIDSKVPTVNGPSPALPNGGVLSGYVDLTNHFSVTGENNGLSYYVDTGRDDGELMEISDPSYWDTSMVEEGQHELVVKTSDDASNTNQVDPDFEIDNADPVLEYTGPDIVSGTVDITEQFSVSDNGTYTVNYGYEAGTTDGNALSVDSDQVDTDQFANGDQIQLEAAVSDTGGQTVTLEETVEVGQADVTSLDLQQTEDGNATVSFDSNVALDAVNVTVKSSDDHFTQSTEKFVRSDFTETEDAGTYTYTLETDLPRDGKYSASMVVGSVEATNGLSIDGNYPTDATLNYDTSAPSLEAAELIDGDENGISLRLEFSEPLSDASNYEDFKGATATEEANPTPNDGVINVTLDSEVQTGDNTEFVVDATEQYDRNDDVGAPDDSTTDTSADVTFELQLSSGLNVVSIPAETGSVDLEAIDQQLQDAGVTNIQAYEPNADTQWPNYVPGNSEDADFTELTGGNGYVVSADQSATLDVNVENVPDGESLDRRSKSLQNGWNLVGHFQEGSQSVDQAYSTLPSGASYSVEQGYTGDQVNTLQPGQGYWTFTDTNDAKLIPVDYTGLNSDRPQIADIQMTSNTDKGDSGLSTGDTVDLSVDVADDDLIESVQLTSSNLGIDATLTDTNNNGEYTATDVSVTLAEAATPGETESLTVTATDADGSVGVGYGDSLAVESTAPTITGVDLQDTESTPDGNIDTAVLTFSEKIDDSTVEAGDFTIGGVQATDKSTVTPNDNTMTVSIDTSSDGSADDGIGTAPVAVDYTADGSGSTGVTDLAGNALDDVNIASDSGTITDSASPLGTPTLSTTPITDTETGDTNEVTVTYSFDEDMQQTTGDVTIDPDVGGDLTTTPTVENKGWTDATTFKVDLQFTDDDEDVSGVTVQATGAKDLAGNVMNSASKDYTVATNTPTFTSGPATTDTAGDNQFSLTAQSSEDVEFHYVVLDGTNTDTPTASNIKAGTDSTGATGVTSGDETTLSTSLDTAISSGISDGNEYDVYVLIEDTDGNQQTGSVTVTPSA